MWLCDVSHTNKHKCDKLGKSNKKLKKTPESDDEPESV